MIWGRCWKERRWSFAKVVIGHGGAALAGGPERRRLKLESGGRRDADLLLKCAS